AQQQPGAWGAQQQPAGWGAQSPAQQQPGAWGAQSPSPQQPGVWGAQSPAQQQPAANAWGAQSSSPQQPGAWGAPSSSPQQPAEWGAAPSSTPSAGAGMGGNQPSWGQDATLRPQKSAQDPWGQPQAAGNAGSPSWQQGPAQGQGFGAPGIQPDAAPMFGANDNDKTMLRPSGPQGTLGTVRVEEGKEPGRVYEVRKDELSIGRSRESDIFLEDLAVSRLHAKIVNLGNGNYALKDEGSANGTKVNGQLVNKYQTYPLQEGDKIQLG